MRVQTHHVVRGGRAIKRNWHRPRRGTTAARSAPRKAVSAFEIFSDTLDDRVNYEQIIRDFESVHDAIVAADEYDS